MSESFAAADVARVSVPDDHREGTDCADAPESLVTRLQGLNQPVPAALVARARVAASTGEGSQERRLVHRRRVRRGLVMALVAGLVGGNAAAAYFAPVYAGVIGKVPGVGDILALTGLGAADVTAINASDQHDGVRVTVVAGYADENGTILTVSIARPGYSGGGDSSNLSLTDQFGHQYQAHNSGFGDKKTPTHTAADGSTPGFVTFAPISGAASVAGARLTLQADDWTGFSATAAGVGAPGSTVHGTWRVTFTLLRHAATHVVWSAASAGDIHYTFPTITITGSKLVQIQWTARGAGVTRALAAADAAAPPTPAGTGADCHLGCSLRPSQDPLAPLRPTWPELIDSAGRLVEPIPFLGGAVWSAQGATESGTLQYVLSSGHYRLVVHAADGSGFERELTIP